MTNGQTPRPQVKSKNDNEKTLQEYVERLILRAINIISTMARSQVTCNRNQADSTNSFLTLYDDVAVFDYIETVFAVFYRTRIKIKHEK